MSNNIKKSNGQNKSQRSHMSSYNFIKKKYAPHIVTGACL